MAAPVFGVLNFNIGVLGHVDSGKTSLSQSLSTVASTACFDKNPQSKERGITIDLGFSSFCVEFPTRLKNEGHTYETLQFTLVDCPGHASLIRTIIGGAQIIDLMMLVIDIVKGIQTQTAECLVIGEITCNKMIVVLNKIDQIPIDKRPSVIDKMSKRILKTLEKTKFADSPIIPVSANPGGSEAREEEPLRIQDLISALCSYAHVPKRSALGSFLYLADHCFSIRGQGTVLTGTVLQGSVSVNDVLEIPSLKVTKKVKSMQMFKKPVEKAVQGDRVGICVTQFDPKQLERGIVCTPGCVALAFAIIILVHKIPYFKGSCTTKSKFHISVLHETLMARCTFFAVIPRQDDKELASNFDFNQEYGYQDELPSDENLESKTSQFALLEFDQPITANVGSLAIGSRLDTDIHANVCRLAFHGRIVHMFGDRQYASNDLPSLRVFKRKAKEGVVERLTNEHEAIAKSLFKKETNIQCFQGLKVTLSTGETGFVEGSFGQSGKSKLRFPSRFLIGGLKEDTISILLKKKTKENANSNEGGPIKVYLSFKRYVYDPKKIIKQ